MHKDALQLLLCPERGVVLDVQIWAYDVIWGERLAKKLGALHRELSEALAAGCRGRAGGSGPCDQVR